MSKKEFNAIMKKARNKPVGEFKCPECDRIFHSKKQLLGHWGGAHRRNYTKDHKPTCKFCNVDLIADKNWAQWAIKQGNLICIPCKRKQNRNSYRNKVRLEKEKYMAKLKRAKARIKKKRLDQANV
jgi:hypothetical protein